MHLLTALNETDRLKINELGATQTVFAGGDHNVGGNPVVESGDGGLRTGR